jgi:Domain of unknwon function (DUF3824)
MSIIYRERERERDRYEDSRSSFSSAPRDKNYTTVKRYRVGGDDDAHSTTFDGRRYGASARDPPARVEETRIVRREREEPEARPERPESNYSRRERVPDARWEDDIVIRRTKEAEEPPPRREYRREEPPTTDRELVIRRTTEADPYERERDIRVERFDDRRRDYRDYEVISPQRENFGDLQKYSRTAEYYSQPNQPQTIVIRNEPIIIRERIRDDDYAVIHRSEVEDRQITRREPSPAKKEEFFYEKKTVERDARPVEREDDFYARREVREVSPGDSVSQVGIRRRSRSRGRSRHSDSDESMVYVRRETKESSRSESPNHRRHLAEGALAGFGAAELLRHHKKSSGKDTSGPLGRLGKDVGAGVLGAVAAQGISRAKSRHRSKSRRREHSGSFDDRDDRHSRRHRSRSRSKTRSQSRSRLKTLGGLALAAAAAGTAVAVAKRRNKNDPEERRSRSRHRRHSASEATDDARNPAHRNKRIAEAGAAGAVVAGLIERARSRSRKRNGERSRSRIRTGLPIAAAGLGSAAIAGIYERNKASREVEAEAAAERRKSRSRSRSHARSAYSEAPRGSVSDPNLIEYGNGPMYGNIPQADYYGRGPAPHDGYYNEAMVPAAAAYGGHREARRSHSRDRRPSSGESSDGGRRHRHRRHSRSRSRDIATPALAAIGGGIAATEYARRKEKKKADKARRRMYVGSAIRTSPDI